MISKDTLNNLHELLTREKLDLRLGVWGEVQLCRTRGCELFEGKVKAIIDYLVMIDGRPVIHTEPYELRQRLVATWAAPVLNTDDKFIVGNEYVIIRTTSPDQISVEGVFTARDTDLTSMCIRFDSKYDQPGCDPRRALVPANFAWDELEAGARVRPTKAAQSSHTSSGSKRWLHPDEIYVVIRKKDSSETGYCAGNKILELSGMMSDTEDGKRTKEKCWFSHRHETEGYYNVLPMQHLFVVEKFTAEQQALLDGLKALAEVPEGKAALAEALSLVLGVNVAPQDAPVTDVPFTDMPVVTNPAVAALGETLGDKSPGEGTPGEGTPGEGTPGEVPLVG